MIANGWRLYYHWIFKAALDELELAVGTLAANDPEGCKTHTTTKLLASVYRAITQLVSANPVKVIVYVWFNDENTLRKAESKTDVYEAFKRMLARAVVPNDIDALVREATRPSTQPLPGQGT